MLRAHKEFDRPLNPLRHLRGGIGIRAEKYITLLPPPLPAPTLKTATENGEEGEEEARARGREGGRGRGTFAMQQYVRISNIHRLKRRHPSLSSPPVRRPSVRVIT